MPFTRGQVSYARLRIGAGPGIAADEGVLDALAERTLDLGERIGVPAETEAGWCAGSHLFDHSFRYEKNIYLDNTAWLAGLRVDTHRVPAEIKRAIKAQHTEAAATAPGGSLSRAQKRDVKDAVERALHEELASGKHRKSALVDILADTERGVVLSAAASNTVLEKLSALYRETFTTSLSTLSAGALAFDLAGEFGARREVEDALPTPFTEPPSGADGTPPEVAWARGSTEPADFLGNEFVLWLWHRVDRQEGVIDADLGEGRTSEVAVVFDKSVELACAWAITGKATLSEDPDGVSPFRLPEARVALAAGKWPRRVGLLLADGSDAYTLTFQADRWLVTGCNVPTPDEKFDTVRDANEHRLTCVRRLDELLVGLYRTFLKIRLTTDWQAERQRLSAWMTSRSTPTKPASMIEPRPRSSTPTPTSSVTEEKPEAAEAAPF